MKPQYVPLNIIFIDNSAIYCITHSVKNQYIQLIIGVISMIFFIFAYISEQNAGICSPIMILGDKFSGQIIIYMFPEYQGSGIMVEYRSSIKRKYLAKPYPENLILTILQGNIDLFEITPDIQAGLEHALAELTQVEQEVLQLRFQEHLTYERIGAVRGRSSHGACGTENNAMRKLRRTSLRGFILYGKEGFEAMDCVFYPPGEIPPPQKEEPDPQLLALPFEELDLSVGALNTLRRAGYGVVGDIVNLSYDQILQINRLSRKRIEEVAAKLRFLGVWNTAWREFLR